MIKTRKLLPFLLLAALAGCGAPATPAPTPLPTSTPIPPTPTVVPLSAMPVWVDPSVPQTLLDQVALPDEMPAAQSAAEALVQIAPTTEGQEADAVWVYALVAPFPTVADGVTLDEVQRTWRGEGNDTFGGKPLLVSAETRAALETLWGPASDTGVRVTEEDTMASAAWADRPSWAIVPFDRLESSWKVLTVDGFDLFDKTTDINAYPLAVRYTLTVAPEVESALASQDVQIALPATNRDTAKMTVLVMTGTTALVRSTADQMLKQGMLFPGKDIRQWLLNADLTHVSNEVSFTPDCPDPDPWFVTLTFCSKPDYIQLLEDLDVDIVEMTGNHLMDYGMDPIGYTFQMYQERGWLYYGAGTNQTEARQPITIENNGNKLAFIGCNYAGPQTDWATDTTPGSATCDFDWMTSEIQRLQGEGYLVIVTLQERESYDTMPYYTVRDSFIRMAETGAVIVSGSQAHFPQGFEYYNGVFIHYGLGNLFFDQMDYPVVGTRREFIDRHVFYDGRYIGTQLLTAMLEDYARPRPMTAEERATFLQDYFTASGW